MTAALAIACIASIHDGDSVRLCDGTRVRIAGIDAPELPGSSACVPANRAKRTRNPVNCDYVAGYASRDALWRILASGEVRIQRTGFDRYGRVLARLWVNGQDVGSMMVAMGYARSWE